MISVPVFFLQTFLFHWLTWVHFIQIIRIRIIRKIHLLNIHYENVLYVSLYILSWTKEKGIENPAQKAYLIYHVSTEEWFTFSLWDGEPNLNRWGSGFFQLNSVNSEFSSSFWDWIWKRTIGILIQLLLKYKTICIWCTIIFL